jgi:iron complex outermembrane receptor protein
LSRRWLLALCLLRTAVPAAEAATPSDDALEFLAEEAKVRSAALEPRPARSAPATAYVITAQDIRSSGATNIWDLLRVAPGVDVMSTRTGQGEVSIRGLDKPLSNRTLVLLDGKTVLNGFFDFVTWKSIPVTLDEIERIEVVEGPASALYGANAINGVINIVTKAPERLNGGLVRYTGGERATQQASALYGKEAGELAYKLGFGLDTTNRFEDSDQRAARNGTFHGLARYRPTEEDELSLSGGYADFRAQTTIGTPDPGFDDGTSSFLRADYAGRGGRARAFWNRGRSVFRDFASIGQPTLDYDAADVQADRTFALPGRNSLTVGAEYRRNAARSSAFPPGTQVQDLPAFFAEDEWRLAPAWTMVASGRADRHPFTGWTFSPRGSVLFDPSPAHLLRLSAGSAFRDPTLTENYLQVTANTSGPAPFTQVQDTILGSRGVGTEKMDFVELAHRGSFGRLKTSVAGFRYWLRDMIAPTPMQIMPSVPPTLSIQSSFANAGGVTAWGGELAAELAVTRALEAFANYSCQSLRDSPGTSSTALSSPRHKGNAGLRARGGGWTASVWADAVDRTYWLAPPGETGFEKVGGYLLINAHAHYDFSGAWRGLEAGVSVFNLADHEHYELAPNHGGERIGGRWTATLSYAF